MAVQQMILFTLALGLYLLAIVPFNSALSLDDYDVNVGSDDDYLYNNGNEPMTMNKRFHSCVSRGNNCDHRPEDCCPNLACRCNLWGANCRCQRKGLFTKLG